ncbi:hypothetical protein SADUNF_Sadunf10G0000200 [Salix dunnii]|uniref:DUF4283 domain-containing protein n=1 Tax=Salix dunnii TaxID=1413687 RepID=A0A835MXJ0_9ROSI|nr:hypothetical protein SADUNF_Sadunf10G0000200 [Salix dunnii]
MIRKPLSCDEHTINYHRPDYAKLCVEPILDEKARGPNGCSSMVWKEHGLEKVTVLDNGFMVFRFAFKEDIKEVLAKGP